MKKRFCLWILCLIMGWLLCGCVSPMTKSATSPEQPLIVVGFSQIGAESDWRNGNTKSMMDTFTPENGYRFMLVDAQQKQENQITTIRTFINQGVDYIVLAPTTEHGWDTVLA